MYCVHVTRSNSLFLENNSSLTLAINHYEFSENPKSKRLFLTGVSAVLMDQRPELLETLQINNTIRYT